MNKILIIFTLIFLSLSIFAEEWTFTGKDYVAKTGEDGDITSLVINGEEFVESSYFYNNDEAFKKELIKDNNKLIVKSELGEAVWDFQPDRIILSVDNINAVNYFVQFKKDVKLNNGYELPKFPYIYTGGVKRLIKEGASLECNGDMKVWGPWNDTAALDYYFQKNPLKVVEILTPGKSSQEEFDLQHHVPKSINFYSPMNYEVFQRETKTDGYISFNGYAKENISDIEFKIEGNDLNNKKVDSGWKNLKTDDFGNFNQKVEIRAGGWYKITIKYKENGVEKFKIIDKVGVGEVIVGAGQSNSTNCGEVCKKTETGMVSSTDGRYWKEGNDPMIGVHDWSPRGSFYPDLGDMLYKEFNVPIGFAVTGHGGSGAEFWQPDSGLFADTGHENLYTWFMSRVYDLGKKGFRCVVWHQGESNVGTDSNVFFGYMANLIESSRKDAGWQIPWFVAKVSYHNPQNQSFDSTRSAHQKLWDMGIAYEGPDTDILKSEYRENNGQGIHFNEIGLKKHAELWAELLIPFIRENIK